MQTTNRSSDDLSNIRFSIYDKSLEATEQLSMTTIKDHSMAPIHHIVCGIVWVARDSSTAAKTGLPVSQSGPLNFLIILPRAFHRPHGRNKDYEIVADSNKLQKV